MSENDPGMPPAGDEGRTSTPEEAAQQTLEKEQERLDFFNDLRAHLEAALEQVGGMADRTQVSVSEAAERVSTLRAGGTENG